MRPSRYLFTLAAIFVVLFVVVFGFGSGSFSDRLKPKLGLDLVGGTTMTLVAKTADGRRTDADRPRAGPRDHREAGQRVRRRRGRGRDRGQRHDHRDLGPGPEQRRRSARSARRRSCASARCSTRPQDVPATAPAPTPRRRARPRAPAPRRARAPGRHDAAPAPRAGHRTAPAPPRRPPAPSPSASATPVRPAQQAVLAKLGDAAASPQASTQLVSRPGQTLDAPTRPRMAQLEPFRDADPGRGRGAAGAACQFNVPQITCEMLERAADRLDRRTRTQQAVACEDRRQHQVPARHGQGASAPTSPTPQANLDTSTGAGWKVDLTFSGDGHRQVDRRSPARPSTTTGRRLPGHPANSTTASGQQPVCMVAVVLDNTVVSAPAIQGVLSTTSQITGSFNKDQRHAAGQPAQVRRAAAHLRAGQR